MDSNSALGDLSTPISALVVLVYTCTNSKEGSFLSTACFPYSSGCTGLVAVLRLDRLIAGSAESPEGAGGPITWCSENRRETCFSGFLRLPNGQHQWLIRANAFTILNKLQLSYGL